ncbi:MAG: hypothetical protein V5A55_12305 [Halovenus sp.]
MGFNEWVRRSYARISENGREGAVDSLYEFYSALWRYVGWHVPRGTNVYEREWDTLVILDACRVDLLREVADDYPFVGPVESFESVGSMSEEWMEKTFTDEYADEVRRTAYVTSNVFSERVLSPDRFLELDEVWRYAWDDSLGIVPPRPVTDRAIAVARNRQPDRLIVHYMQPHHPFVSGDTAGAFAADPFGRENETTVVDALRKGRISRDAFWEAYRDNLHLVLEDVAVLLANHDAETVVISADHGDALGEWGIYDHPAGCLHPVVKNVPWVETTATDEGGYEPTLDPDDGEADVEERLRRLGYL